MQQGLAGTRVAVVGAGPIGLHTSAELTAKGANVTVLRAGPLVHPNHVGVAAAAAGLIEPVATAREDDGLVEELFLAALPVWMTADPALGVDRRRVRFHAGSQGVPSWVRHMPRAQHDADGSWTFLSAVVTPQIWLAEKAKSLRSSGVIMLKEPVEDLDALTSRYDIVVNASGPGAWAFGDGEMFGTRAVIVWVEAKVEEVRFDDDRFLYGIPQRRLVAFGGTRDRVSGDPATWDRRVYRSDVERLLAGAHELYPELNKLNVVGTTCNYRPERSRLRIEIEESADKLILHLTGLGGSGWTLAPSVARRGIRLLEEARTSQQRTRTA